MPPFRQLIRKSADAVDQRSAAGDRNRAARLRPVYLSGVAVTGRRWWRIGQDAGSLEAAVHRVTREEPRLRGAVVARSFEALTAGTFASRARESAASNLKPEVDT